MVYVAKRLPPSSKYVIWKMGLLLLILTPFSIFLPSMMFESTKIDPGVTAFLEQIPSPYSPTLEQDQFYPESLALENISERGRLGAEFTWSLPHLVVGIWILGSILVTLFVGWEIRFLKGLMRNGCHTANDKWRDILRSCCKNLDIEEGVRLGISERVTVPMTFGWRKPVIVMPIDAVDWSESKIKTVFLHELGHIKQKDFLTNLGIQLVRALYWWNPLVWWAAKKTRIAGEQSCDELVVRCGISYLDYAQQLVEVAKSIRHRWLQPSQTAVAMTRRSELSERIHVILRHTTLEPTRSAKRLSWLCLMLLVPLLLMNFSYRYSVPESLSESSLIAMLESSDKVTKMHALWALGSMQSKLALKPLSKSMQDSDPQIRAAAAWALGRLDKTDALNYLHKSLKDEHDVVKEMVLLAIAEYGLTQSFYMVAKTHLHSNPEVRKATLWSLYQIGCLPAFHLISQHIQDQDSEVSHLATQLIDEFPREKLRYWIQQKRDRNGDEWALSHLKGVIQEGTLDQFTSRLAIDLPEKQQLDQIIQLGNEHSTMAQLRNHVGHSSRL